MGNEASPSALSAADKTAQKERTLTSQRSVIDSGRQQCKWPANARRAFSGEAAALQDFTRLEEAKKRVDSILCLGIGFECATVWGRRRWASTLLQHVSREAAFVSRNRPNFEKHKVLQGVAEASEKGVKVE